MINVAFVTLSAPELISYQVSKSSCGSQRISSRRRTLFCSSILIPSDVMNKSASAKVTMTVSARSYEIKSGFSNIISIYISVCDIEVTFHFAICTFSGSCSSDGSMKTVREGSQTSGSFSKWILDKSITSRSIYWIGSENVMNI